MGYMEKELTDLQKGTIYTTEEIASIVNNKKMQCFCVMIPHIFKKEIPHPPIL